MSLQEKISEEIKIALKQGEGLKLSTLRMLWAEIKNLEINKQDLLTDEEVLGAIQKQVKNHRESITSFEAGGRLDLVAKEKQELEILNSYLPQQLSPGEIKIEVNKVINQLGPGPTDFGKVMKEVMIKVKGRAEGNLVSQIVRESLSNS